MLDLQQTSAESAVRFLQSWISLLCHADRYNWLKNETVLSLLNNAVMCVVPSDDCLKRTLVHFIKPLKTYLKEAGQKRTYLLTYNKMPILLDAELMRKFPWIAFICVKTCIKCCRTIYRDFQILAGEQRDASFDEIMKNVYSHSNIWLTIDEFPLLLWIQFCLAIADDSPLFYLASIELSEQLTEIDNSVNRYLITSGAFSS
ncbi:unnamed protein product [Soboliphyme baturini]|uniref:Uncharacterized protein n=1 Tax=Soboliphyme baturini TaxID=241478 RepID=A0A183IJB2_9BILA|nr:unnamed protein product [Soboliphyme baturini]